MVSTRLILIAFVAAAAATFTVQEASAVNIRGGAANNYVGCFRDASSRALGLSFLGGASLDSCSAHCEGKGATYFGLQWKSECWCGGADYAKYGALSSSSCNTPCIHSPGVMCGGGWANSVYKIIVAPKEPYVGCFRDAKPRALGLSFLAGASLESCSAHCEGKGASYFGLQWKSECWCGGADYAKYGALSSGSCNTPCTHSPGVMCGGGWANSVYKIAVAPKETYVGCFRDANPRALGLSNVNGKSKEQCSAHCTAQGAAYYGLQWYNQCFCGGADYAKYGALSSGSCNTACTHSPGVMCGGGWANSVYKLAGGHTGTVVTSRSGESMTKDQVGKFLFGSNY